METDLMKKLGLSEASQAVVLHAPDGYRDIVPVAEPIQDINRIPSSSIWLQAFYIDHLQLEQEVSILARQLAKDGQLWICWPKKASGITSDVSETLVREIGLQTGLVDTKIVAINSIWSGLKFVYRLADR